MGMLSWCMHVCVLSVELARICQGREQIWTFVIVQYNSVHLSRQKPKTAAYLRLDMDFLKPGCFKPNTHLKSAEHPQAGYC